MRKEISSIHYYATHNVKFTLFTITRTSSSFVSLLMSLAITLNYNKEFLVFEYTNLKSCSLQNLFNCWLNKNNNKRTMSSHNINLPKQISTNCCLFVGPAIVCLSVLPKQKLFWMVVLSQCLFNQQINIHKNFLSFDLIQRAKRIIEVSLWIKARNTRRITRRHQLCLSLCPR